MSYVQQKIGTKDVFEEYRLVYVNTGVPAPTPASGYQMSPKLYTVYGKDFYMEYKEVTSAIVNVI